MELYVFGISTKGKRCFGVCVALNGGMADTIEGEAVGIHVWS
jgi:hypothetical protein